jgi:hypothetical protein
MSDWNVLERDRFGEPLRVEHAIPYMRGSFIEASYNLRLAVTRFGRELRHAWPLSLLFRILR